MLRDDAARVGGRALRGLFAVVLQMRRPRPIHVRGRNLEGELTWLGNPVKAGIAWIDAHEGPLPVVARLSRSVGLPAPLPDVIGLALRFDTGGRPADLELASTGFGVPGRFVLLAHRAPSSARLGTLLPYRSSLGPLLICARTIEPESLPSGGSELDEALTVRPWRLRLYFAHGAGKWHPFAELSLRLTVPVPADERRFDAVRNPLPGAETYEWTRLLREPSYHLAQE